MEILLFHIIVYVLVALSIIGIVIYVLSSKKPNNTKSDTPKSTAIGWFYNTLVNSWDYGVIK